MSRRFKQEVFPDEEISFPPDLSVITVLQSTEQPIVKVLFSRTMTEEELQALRDGLRSVFNG